MNVSTPHDATLFENSNVCRGASYPAGSADIDGAVITVSGRYPSEGFLTNDICKELVYIVSGTGILLSPSETVRFNEGDVVFIDKNETFAWDGSFVGFFATTPRFDPGQHREVKP